MNADLINFYSRLSAFICGKIFIIFAIILTLDNLFSVAVFHVRDVIEAQKLSQSKFS